MPQSSGVEEYETYFIQPMLNLLRQLWGSIEKDTPSTTPARPTGRLEMEENKPTSTASAPSGSTSTADQENRTHTRSMLLGHLQRFAAAYNCPNPWSWAQAWASTVIGPSWKNWDMPSGDPLQTGLNKLVENTGSRPILAELPMQQASSAPPAPTGEKTEEKGSSKPESFEDGLSNFLGVFYRANYAQKECAKYELNHVFPDWFAPAGTSVPASGEISQIPPSAPLVIGAYKFKPSTVLEILPNQNGTLTLVLRPAAPTGR